MKKYLYIAMVIAFVVGCKKENGAEENLEEEVPTIPTLLQPDNKKLCIGNEVVFSWDKSNTKKGVVSYVLEISKKQDFQNREHHFEQKETQKTVTLEKGVLYFWRVKAVGSNGKSSKYSSVYQFYTEGEVIKNHFPFAPTLVSPKMNEEISSEEVTLKWESTDIDKDALTYIVYFGTENPPKEKKGDNISEKSLKVELKKEGDYFWRVDVKDAKGAITRGQVWFFSKK